MDIQIWANNVFRQIILGTYDAKSPLHLLQHQKDVLLQIMVFVVEYWKSQIDSSSDVHSTEIALLFVVKIPTEDTEIKE